MYSGTRGETMSQGRSAFELRTLNDKAENLKRVRRSRERPASFLAH
jgi:hypothetical protein